MRAVLVYTTPQPLRRHRAPSLGSRRSTGEAQPWTLTHTTTTPPFTTRCFCPAASRASISACCMTSCWACRSKTWRASRTGLPARSPPRGLPSRCTATTRPTNASSPSTAFREVLSGEEWSGLEAGLTQRLKALNMFLEDVYGPARIIEDGVIPLDVVRGCPQYRVEMRGFSALHGTWVAICGTDIVRTNDGFMVLEDNLRVPSGVSYMLANRKAAKSSLRRLYRSLSRARGGTLRPDARGHAARACPARNCGPFHRAADARCVQLRLLRAHVSGARAGGGAGGGTRPAGERRVRVHAHHFRTEACGRDLPPRRRRLHRPACVPSGLAAGRTRPDARLQAGQR